MLVSWPSEDERGIMPSIDAIEGIDAKFARQLRKAGVRTTEGLLKRAGTKRDRAVLAALIGTKEDQLHRWVNASDMMRVRGIGSEYTMLLGKVGVVTVSDLKRRNPKLLAAAMAELNDKKRLVRRLPTEAMVADWIVTAKALVASVK